MQQAQLLLFSKRLTEFHTLHAIQSYAFQELSLALVLLLLFHHYVPAKTPADSDKCLLKPLFSLKSAARLWKKIPLPLTDSQKPENLINTEH